MKKMPHLPLLQSRQLLACFLFSILLHSCSSGKNFRFLVFSDTHCMDSLNRFQVLDSMVQDANNIHQAAFPDSFSFLKNKVPKGVLVCGDLTNDGMPAQWQQFRQLFGVRKEGNINIPVYETFGNHDGDTAGIVRNGIKQRNLHRKKLSAVSSNGLHYSWDWGNFHFVSLGSYPGNQWDSTCNWCHYFKRSFREPENSLAFLKEDLARIHGKNKQLVLYFHYGWDSFSQLWWTTTEQQEFYKVIQPYRVAAIFTGHNHATGHMSWNGIDVYSAGSPQSTNKTGSYFSVQVQKKSLYVLERRYRQWGTQFFQKKIQ